MTSKEALKDLLYLKHGGYRYKIYELIKKDLDVLELIKEHICFDYQDSRCFEHWSISLEEDDSEILRKWLNEGI